MRMKYKNKKFIWILETLTVYGHFICILHVWATHSTINIGFDILQFPIWLVFVWLGWLVGWCLFVYLFVYICFIGTVVSSPFRFFLLAFFRVLSVEFLSAKYFLSLHFFISIKFYGICKYFAGNCSDSIPFNLIIIFIVMFHPKSNKKKLSNKKQQATRRYR